MNFTNKLLLLVMGGVLLTLSASYYFHVSQIRPHLQNNQIEWVSTLMNGLTEGIAKDTINGDKVPVRNLLKRIAQDEAIEFAYVTDMNGELFTHTFESGFPKFLLHNLNIDSNNTTKLENSRVYQTKQGEIIEFDTALVEGLPARIYVGLNQVEVDNLISQVNISLLWFMGLLGLLGLGVALYIARKISLPLTHFTQKLLTFDGRSKFPTIKTSDPDINNLVNVFANLISQREAAEIALKESQQRLQLHRKLSPIGVIEWSTDFRFLDVNIAAEKMFGFKKDELVGKQIYNSILPESARKQVDVFWEKLISNTGGEYSINENITKDGRIITCEWNNTPLVNDAGEVVGVASFVEDITHQLQQEEQIRRTKKMDALGKLTGGIAHDYNNTLGVIIGFSELIKSGSLSDDKVMDFVDQIYHAGKRGAKLTQKLLSISKNKPFIAERVDINKLINDESLMIERTLTARIKCEFDLAPDLWEVFLDKSDFEDSLLNMSINAMHAIEGTGAFTITTGNLSMTTKDAEVVGLAGGDYVQVRLADTGCGMESNTIERIFDPFFTSKGDLGTGLGLSQVYGFVQRSDGAIQVTSEEGTGSQFILYFPRVDESVKSSTERVGLDEERLQGDEVILIVDDEPSLRKLYESSVKAYGYQVFSAATAQAALDILSTQHIDLIVSDVIMPKMSGFALAERVREDYPNIKIQLISGYNDRMANLGDHSTLEKNVLIKPFELPVLLKRIRQLLDG